MNERIVSTRTAGFFHWQAEQRGQTANRVIAPERDWSVPNEPEVLVSNLPEPTVTADGFTVHHSRATVERADRYGRCAYPGSSSHYDPRNTGTCVLCRVELSYR